MANIFTLNNVDDFNEKIDIDELYEKKRQHDLSQLALYNKILNRIHVKIKLTSRQKMNDHFCCYVVPEMIIGVPKYDQAGCIAYILDKLSNNGFNVKYIHPNTLWIAWNHWVPSYVRNEIKKKTGITVNEYGKNISEKDIQPNQQREIQLSNQSSRSSSQLYSQKQPQLQSDESNLFSGLMNNMNINKQQDVNNIFKESTQTKEKSYTPINSYKPGGNLVYDEELIRNLHKLS